MRRVKFFCNTGFVGAKREEVIEFDDDATYEGIEAEFEIWLTNFDIGWYELEDDEDE